MKRQGLRVGLYALVWCLLTAGTGLAQSPLVRATDRLAENLMAYGRSEQSFTPICRNLAGPAQNRCVMVQTMAGDIAEIRLRILDQVGIESMIIPERRQAWWTGFVRPHIRRAVEAGPRQIGLLRDALPEIQDTALMPVVLALITQATEGSAIVAEFAALDIR